MEKLIEIEYIRKHSLYQECYIRLQKSGRRGKSTFADTQWNILLMLLALRGYWNLEQDFGIRKPVIYGMALLHDIGKYRQYEEGLSTRKSIRRNCENHIP